MDSLVDAARHRAVLTTVADVIVAAATDKSLRVAVGGTHPNEVIFADYLTRAGTSATCAESTSASTHPPTPPHRATTRTMSQAVNPPATTSANRTSSSTTWTPPAR